MSSNASASKVRGAVSCWSGAGYLSSDDVCLCLTKGARVVLARGCNRRVAMPERKPEDLLKVVPIDYYGDVERRACKAPVQVSSLDELIEWLRPPCYLYGPCTCACRDESVNLVFAYPCPEDWDGGRACLESGSTWCREVALQSALLQLVFYPAGSCYVYRYIAFVGATEAFVAPFPPSLTASTTFEAVMGVADPKRVESVRRAYGGITPSASTFVGGGVTLNLEHFPELWGVVGRSSGLLYVSFEPRVAAFNMYKISRSKAHAVVVAWVEDDVEAFTLALACWGMWRDIYEPVVKLLGRGFLNKVERVYGYFTPVDIGMVHEVDPRTKLLLYR